MPRGPRAEALAEAQRKRILYAAIEVFAGTGYIGTTINAIAAKAGLSHGLVNHYFGSKADLYLTAVVSGLDYMREINRMTLQADGSPEERLRRWALEYTRSMATAFNYTRLVMQVLGAYLAHPEQCVVELDRFYFEQVDLLKTALSELGRSPEVAARQAWLAFHTIPGVRFMGGWLPDQTQNVTSLYELGCHIFDVDPAPRPEPMQMPPLPWVEE